MKILVTGAATFIGSHVVDKLIRKHSAQIIAIDDLSNGHREDVNQRAKFKMMSLKNVDKMVSFLRGCDAVIHCADSSNHFLNIENTDLLLKAMRAAEVKRIVNLSSGEVYGEGQLGMYPVSEDVVTLTSPSTLYGASKLAQEILCNQFANQSGGHAVSLRLGLSLGPRASYQDPVNCIIRSFLLGENQKVFPFSEKEEYDFVHIYDVRDLVLTALFHIDLFTAEVFNAGSGKSSSLKEMASYVETLLGSSPYEFVPSQYNTHRATRLNMHKASRELSFLPRRNISDAITDELAWLRAGNNLERWKEKNASG